MKSNRFKTLFYSVNFLLYLVTLALWISIPDEVMLNSVVSILALALTCTLIVWDRDRLKTYYLSSQFKNLAGTLFTGALVFVIVAFLNYFGYKHPLHGDMTAFGRQSLTDQSVKTAKSIEKPISVKVFAKKNVLPLIQRLMELYVFQNHKIKVEYIDEDVRPDLVSRYQIQKSGSILMEYGDRKKVVTELNELQITNAFIQVTRNKNPVIAFLRGHGETEIENASNEGLSFLKVLIQNSNYDLTSLSLMTLGSIPENINTLVIWGPKTAFSDQDVEKIDQYLKKGGHLVLALDPNFKGDQFQNLRLMLEERGIYVSNDLVIDKLKHINGSNGTVPMVDKFQGESPIVKDFKGPVFFPLASSIKFSRSADIKGEFQPLAQSLPFPASWAEQTLKEVVDGKVVYSKDVDIRGPITMAGTWESSSKNTTDKKSRIIVFGNSSFVNNTYQKFVGNYTLLLNSLSWSTGDLDLISLNMPILKDEPVFISKPQLGVIFYFSVIFAPLVMVILAIVFYRRRIYL